jgi:hypothetical protein
VPAIWETTERQISSISFTNTDTRYLTLKFLDLCKKDS